MYVLGWPKHSFGFSVRCYWKTQTNWFWPAQYMHKYVLTSFLVAQMVKNLLAVQETWVGSLGWEEPLEKGMATCSSILTWRIPWTKEPAGYSTWGCKESDVIDQLTLTDSCTRKTYVHMTLFSIYFIEQTLICCNFPWCNMSLFNPKEDTFKLK